MDLVDLYQIDAQKIMIPGRPISTEFLYPAHDEFGIPYRFTVNKEDITTKSNIKLDCTLNNNNIIGDWWAKQAFLYCGRIGSNKGVDIILKAWCCLKDIFNDYCPALWIVGGSPNEIENLKDELSIQYNIKKHEECGDLIWWGYLDQRGISTLMLKSHALIMHSSYEPGGRVIIEALSSGIPVIATPYGFGADYIYDWYNGFQVPFGDIDFLYHILSLFIKQPYLSNVLGLNAKSYMQKVINEWDFYNVHQIVYDITIAGINENFESTGLISIPKFHKNYLNTYPYFNNVITNQELTSLIKEELQQEHLNLNPVFSENSAMWITSIGSVEYEIWQPYTMSMDNVYYFPFRDTIVDKRNNLYARENYTFALSINPIWHKIDSHYIYIKEKHTNLQWKQLQKIQIQNSVSTLLNESNAYNTTTIQSKLTLFNCDWQNSSIDKIKDTYEIYYKEIPKWLYHSHNINLGLSVRQLHFILTDSHNMQSEDVLNLYNECVDYLYRIAQVNPARYGECIENCSINNIVFNSNTSKCLFKSASTLYFGDTSRMTADFLHNYLLFLLSKNDDLSKLDSYIDTFIPYQHKSLCIGWIFVIVFEKLSLYLNRLQKTLFKNEYMLLNKLKVIYVDDEKTS